MDPINAKVLSYALVFAGGVMAGMWVPGSYLTERMEGFGRYMIDLLLPYKPPPGMTAKEALQAAAAANSIGYEVDPGADDDDEDADVAAPDGGGAT